MDDGGFSDPGSELEEKHRKARHQNKHRNHHNHHRSRSSRHDMPPFQPFQTSVSLDENRDGQEVIEVQILPQDENWGENTTAVTGNTSEGSGSATDLAAWGDSDLDTGRFGIACRRHLLNILTYTVALSSFVTPIAMVVLPRIGVFPALKQMTCDAACTGELAALSLRLVLLAATAWGVFLRPAVATLPRVQLLRAAALAVLVIATASYWLFYIVQVTEQAALAADPNTVQYAGLVAYAASLTDTLLYTLVVAVLVIELRHLQPTYYIKVVRSPDGESRSYSIGPMSVQRAAVWVLQHYYTEFPIYNPYLERIPVSSRRQRRQAAATDSSFKFYDVDGSGGGPDMTQSRAVLAAHARRRDSAHNERFYEEHEYERRVKKRRARLITAAEEAFTHIKRLHGDQVLSGGSTQLDAQEAAAAVFPGMARALQKYLRVTRQQPRFTADAILAHLVVCLKHDLSPRAFLEPFLNTSPALSAVHEQRDLQVWALFCEQLLSRPLAPGMQFQLRQQDVALLVHVYKMPHFTLTEEIIHPKSNRFVLRLNSETSV